MEDSVMPARFSSIGMFSDLYSVTMYRADETSVLVTQFKVEAVTVWIVISLLSVWSPVRCNCR